jgi:Caspase domain
MAGQVYGIHYGIDAYEGAELNGCVNDARAWNDVWYERCGPRYEQVALLLDDQATPSNLFKAHREVESRVAELAERAGVEPAALPEGLVPTVVQTGSGHGSWLYERGAVLDEEDRRDECLVLWPDPSFPDGSAQERELRAGLVRDDALRPHLQCAGARTVCVADVCFSGGLFRDFSTLMQRDRQPKIRFLPPDLLLNQREIGLVRSNDFGYDHRPQWRPFFRPLGLVLGAFERGPAYLLYTASREDEYSYEDGDRGAYSKRAQQALRDGAPTYFAWHQAAKQATTAAFPQQHPTLRGTRSMRALPVPA